MPRRQDSVATPGMNQGAIQSSTRRHVDLLDGLRPQPVKDVVSLHELSQAIEIKVSNVLARKWQAATIQAEIEEKKGKLQEPSLVSFCPVYTSRLNRMLIG